MRIDTSPGKHLGFSISTTTKIKVKMGRTLELWLVLAPATASKGDALRSLDRAYLNHGLMPEDVFVMSREDFVAGKITWPALRHLLTTELDIPHAEVVC